MSLVQPAQQMYLRGSSIEIERLSPLRSCPSSAHDGHRVTLLCPTVRSAVLMWSRIRNRSRVSRHVQLRLGFWWRKLRWDCLPGDQSGKLLTRHLRKRIEVAHLRPDILIGAVKPEALSCAPVNAQRSTDGIAIPARLQVSCLGKISIPSRCLPCLIGMPSRRARSHT